MTSKTTKTGEERVGSSIVAFKFLSQEETYTHISLNTTSHVSPINEKVVRENSLHVYPERKWELNMSKYNYFPVIQWFIDLHILNYDYVSKLKC